ncbi:U32 family peptidase [Phormidium sp. LEGE 05292]|uniref:peptidase U32 family protein n=1 Tax=[Phormidium] sp. LEGE 05292 TaxID=767427 RepID=UPI00187ED3C3|nr:peptidase U32 family protein [Phormidium sp. LEGE 05292]MBE9226838.1 U32 family peptidase [Phormidium sp. LEGE 05292]
MWKPELLAPAKNLERLKVAIAYGADAIYLGGQNYGLRARADNFTDYELEQAVVFAHQHNAKIYVTLNAFLHDTDFVGLAEYCHFLESIGVDAVIVSDLGVIRAIRNSSNLNIHLSTQASCLNSYAGLLWKEMGVKRLIVGRELTIAEAGAIREKSGIEVEMFTHGAMCMAYSGHCTISNFTAGRDSNRGGCIQSCRLPYHLETEEKKSDDLVTFMSSRDLWGIYQIGEFFQHQICSLKIEGRMKSSFYVGLTCKVYRQLIDAYAAGTLNAEMLQVAARELQSVPNRDYFSGSLETPAGRDSVFGQLSGINTGTYEYLGLVVDTTPEEIVLRLVEPFALGEEIEIIPFEGEAIRGKVDRLFSATGESVEFMRQDSIARIPKFPAATKAGNIAKFNVVRFKSAVKEVTHAI